ncbi:MAG TPA: PhzF family phenazine biosynthesis protein [Candidatus Lokiarchaeia archaeon]|nr:PhzF family phenazine biosynthesis protein [Candidatus Lokiarchaeia archaeon]
MPRFDFWILDVFAEKKYAGNQLAVIKNDGEIPSEIMQSIACEMHFSETTFVSPIPESDGSYRTRIFTPTGEVPFAGHPTLGTAFIVQQEFMTQPVDTITLREGAGSIPVAFTYEDVTPVILWMRQLQPSFGTVHDPAEIARIVSLSADDIDQGFPIEEVSTGLPFTIIPVTTLAAMQKARTNMDHYNIFSKNTEAKGLLLFCPETHDPSNHVNVRMFAEEYGIVEDPATGSGCGCLAAYLARHQYFGSSSIDICAEQGTEIGRPSRLYLKAMDDGDAIEVQVGGKVVLVARGTLI